MFAAPNLNFGAESRGVNRVFQSGCRTLVRHYFGEPPLPAGIGFIVKGSRMGS
jgi:hypothetical protein